MNRDVNVGRLRSELDELHDRRNGLDRLIERKRLLMLKALPGVHGFESMDALIGTLAQFASGDLRERIRAAQPASPRRGKPRSYPAELRTAVRKALEAGESASQIARAKSISLATVIKWKKLWALESPLSGARSIDATPIEPGGGAEATVGATPTSGAQASGSREEWAL